MIQFDFTDNTIVNLIPIEPSAPQMMFIPTEESATWPLRSYTSSEAANEGISQTPYSLNSTGDPGNVDLLFPGMKNPTHYVGVSTVNVPHVINPDFTDFIICNDDIDAEELFLDESEKIKLFDNNIQLLEVPINRFKDYELDLFNYGTYYLSIKPKHIETSIISVEKGKHLDYNDLSDEYSTENDTTRRTHYEVSKEHFEDTPWDFFDVAYRYQKGRLLGSVVEVYSSSGELKTTRFIVNNDFFSKLNITDPANNTTARIELSPNYIGYDSPQQQIDVGDTLKIYPRETYFNPISLILNFQPTETSVKGLIQYLKNDVVRDIKTNIYQIYDEEGVSVTNGGDIDGNVVQEYQILQVGDKEVRKNFKS
jgi:hypothetical protein